MWWVVDDCGESGGGKMKKDTHMTWFDSRTATVPQQWRQKACWYLLTQTDKSASARIPLYLSPGVFQGIDFHGE